MSNVVFRSKSDHAEIFILVGATMILELAHLHPLSMPFAEVVVDLC